MGVAYHTVQRVLITGGAGFIGSHLAEALVAEGKEVFVIDDFPRSTLDKIAKAALRARVADHPI